MHKNMKFTMKCTKHLAYKLVLMQKPIVGDIYQLSWHNII